MLAVSDSVPERHRTVRDWAVAKLTEIESALRDEDDVAAMEVVQRAINELQGDLGVRDRVKQPAAGRLRQAAAAVGSSIHAATGAASTAVRTGASRATGDIATAATIVAEKGGTMVRSGASGAAAGFGVAHAALADFAKNLDWDTVREIAPKEYLDKFVTAGTRGVDRTLDEARSVWETIPEQSRAMGPEEVSKHLWGAESQADRFDWSHIVPHSQGGSNEAANGIFELASLNWSRGGKLMEQHEYDAAVQVLKDTAFEPALAKTASQVLSGVAWRLQFLACCHAWNMVLSISAVRSAGTRCFSSSGGRWPSPLLSGRQWLASWLLSHWPSPPSFRSLHR